MNNAKGIVLSVAMALMMITVCFVASDMCGDDSNDVTVVNNETELRGAIKDNANIELGKNICFLNENLVIGNTNVTIDGRGHSIECNVGLGEYLVEVRSNGCTLKNITFDCYNSAKGVYVKNADGVTFSYVNVTRSTGCALTVDMSNVNITSEFSMSNNGEKIRGVGQGDYIRLAWSGNFEDASKCSVTFDPEDKYQLYKYDGINCSIKQDDLTNAGVSKDTFRDKFSVKDGTYEFSNSVYGTSDNHTIILNNGVASVGGVRYAGLGDAAYAAAGTGETVELTQDVMASGFKLPDGHGSVAIDLKGHKYTLMRTEGVDSGYVNNFYFDTGGKVSISNGNLNCIDPTTYKMIETKCDIDLEWVGIDVKNIEHKESPARSDTTYGLSVDGATATLTYSDIDAKWAENENRSYIITNNSTLVFKGKDQYKGDIRGDAIIEGNSTLIVEGKYQQDFAVMGHGSELRLISGTISMKADSLFSAEVYGDEYKNCAGFERIHVVSDSSITSGRMTITGSFEGDVSGNLFLDNHYVGDDGNHMYVAITIGANLTLSIMADVNLEKDIRMLPGSELTIANGKSLFCLNGSRLVIDAGCRFEESQIRSTHIVDVGPGGTETEQVALFFVGSEHAKTVLFGMMPMDTVQFEKGQTFILNLYRLSALTDDGYKVIGWMVDGKQCGLMEEVKITENSVIIPITEKVEDISVMYLVIGILVAATMIVAAVQYRK